MIVTAGSTDVSLYFYFVGDAGSATPGEPVTGLAFGDITSISYVRPGAARASGGTPATQTAAGAHTDGGFAEVDATNCPGLYRVDFADAAFASGVSQVYCFVKSDGTNNEVAAPIIVDITAVDLSDNVRGGMTALPNAAADAAGGLPISDGGGLDLDAILVDTGTTIPGLLSTIDTVVDAILLDTGTDGVSISAATANQIADAILNRDFSSVSDTNARTALNALRFLRNKYSVTGTTLTVTKEDDTTSAWTSTLTTDAAADPVTGSDPA